MSIGYLTVIATDDDETEFINTVTKNIDSAYAGFHMAADDIAPTLETLYLRAETLANECSRLVSYLDDIRRKYAKE